MQSGNFHYTALDNLLKVRIGTEDIDLPPTNNAQIVEQEATSQDYAQSNRITISASGSQPTPYLTFSGAWNPDHPGVKYLRANLGKPVFVTYQTPPEEVIYEDATAMASIAQTTGLVTFTVKTPPEVPVGDANVRGLVDVGHALVIGGKAYTIAKIAGAAVTCWAYDTNRAPTAAVAAAKYKIVRLQLRHQAFFTVAQAGGAPTNDASGVVTPTSYRLNARDNQLTWSAVIS